MRQVSETAGRPSQEVGTREREREGGGKKLSVKSLRFAARERGREGKREKGKREREGERETDREREREKKTIWKIIFIILYKY